MPSYGSCSDEPGDLTSAEARAHPLVFYRRFFTGWTPDDLSARAPIVYERLRRRGLLRLIPGKTPPPFGGDPLAHYRQRYAGLTRGQVRDQEPGLYERLRRDGLLAYIPLKPRVRFGDPAAYYREHCPGMTRKQAAMAEPQFYSYLQRNGLLGAIPFSPAKAAGYAGARRPGMLPEGSPGGQTSDPAERPPPPAPPVTVREAGVLPDHSGISHGAPPAAPPGGPVLPPGGPDPHRFPLPIETTH